MKTIVFRGRQLWPRPPRRRGAHVSDQADPRSPLQRWQDGPRPAPQRHPDPDVGSMSLAEDRAWRYGRCDDTGEYFGTMLQPAVGYQPAPLTLGLHAVPAVCPRCEAPDDGPHYEICPFYDQDEAALFGADVNAVLAPIEARARALDPEAWRPYVTAEEFTGMFPGVPYTAAEDLGVSPADLARAAQLDPGHAEEILAAQADHRDYVAQRAMAFALDRGRQLVAWRAIGA